MNHLNFSREIWKRSLTGDFYLKKLSSTLRTRRVRKKKTLSMQGQDLWKTSLSTRRIDIRSTCKTPCPTWSEKCRYYVPTYLSSPIIAYPKIFCILTLQTRLRSSMDVYQRSRYWSQNNIFRMSWISFDPRRCVPEHGSNNKLYKHGISTWFTPEF